MINEKLLFLFLFVDTVFVVALIDYDIFVVVVEPRNLPLKFAQNWVSNR